MLPPGAVIGDQVEHLVGEVFWFLWIICIPCSPVETPD